MTTTTNIPNQTQSPGFFSQVYQTGRSGVEWLTNNAKGLGNSLWDLTARVWKATASFFSGAGCYLSNWGSKAKIALGTATQHLTSLPNETKILGAALLIGSTTVSFFAGRCWAPSGPDQAGQQAVTI